MLPPAQTSTCQFSFDVTGTVLPPQGTPSPHSSASLAAMAGDASSTESQQDDHGGETEFLSLQPADGHGASISSFLIPRLS
ncbi:hypothetical protein CCMA1212_003991 [Trichoderma ghanense]|uniref:Uncharacterized protein n=1 Tax=Trichoderma ghanense TaxID=65468 RepID=A0ABY2H7A7_9HYPO